MEEQCRNNWTCVRQKIGRKRRGKEGEKNEGRKERERKRNLQGSNGETDIENRLMDGRRGCDVWRE